LPAGDRWDRLAAESILVLGSPRSGTTWLAKIFDSHPDILYRHEPDEVSPLRHGLPPPAQLRTWLRQRSLRAAAKRPGFAKSWRPAPLDATRTALATGLAAAQRLKMTAPLVMPMGLPDLVQPRRWGRVRAAMKLVNWDGSGVARLMPDTRTVFILRHPCGQVASVMAGLAANRFGGGSLAGPELDLAAAETLAAARGVGPDAFAALPDAAKLAWSWRAFNEPAVESLDSLPNARVIVYEDLCRDPEAVAKDLFAFADLGWHPQTAAFLGSSTNHGGPNGYFDVFRATSAVADRWRQSMSRTDQDAVRAVVLGSPLGSCWSDLASPAHGS
jgi:hypothetical protein